MKHRYFSYSNYIKEVLENQLIGIFFTPSLIKQDHICGLDMKIVNLKLLNKSVDCRFMDFYVDVDFARIFGVDCRKHAKML